MLACDYCNWKDAKGNCARCEKYENCENVRWFDMGRADALEPIKAIIEESEKMMWHSSKTLENIKEKLKEQKNELV